MIIKECLKISRHPKELIRGFETNREKVAMLKKWMESVLLFVMLISIGCTCAFADADYEYEIQNGAAVLTKYIGSEMADVVVPSLINGYPVTEIGASAFEGQALTGTLTLPEGLLKIGDKAFSNCNTLTGNLVIPNSVEEIGAQAFYMGGNMADHPRGTLTLGQNLKTIGDRAFVVNANTAEYSCSQGYTGTLTIPSGVQKIGSGAFNGNVNLTGDLILPDTITEIGSDAFCSLRL